MELPAFDLEAAMRQLGLSLYTNEWAAKVLAFTHCLGGCDEVVLTNPALRFAIDASFRKLYPNNRLDAAFLNLMQDHIKELKQKGLATPWLADIAKRYGLGDLREMWEKAGLV